MGHGSRPNQKILALAESNDPGCGKEFNFSLCRVRHMAAKLREERGRRNEYEPCCYCPEIIDHIRKEKGDEYMNVIIKNRKDVPPDGRLPCKICGTIAKVDEHGHCLPCQENSTPEVSPAVPTVPAEKPSLCKCGKALTKNGHCHSCAMKGKKNRVKAKTYPAPPAPKTKTENDSLEKITKGEWPPIVKIGYREMPGVGEYIPEPAANTIHASKPPKPEPTKINEIDVCRQAIHKHGISRQLAKAAEEFSEAAAAISRFLAGEGEYAEIICEVADVEVMCLQMRLIYGTDSIEQVRAEKVARLHERLKL